ncbi:MAG: PssD/Cps14F family polysaccharide biosynthesis glycosyltransferase [Candidatus Woesearchaeota archaeon]
MDNTTNTMYNCMDGIYMKVCYISSSGGHFNELKVIVGKINCDDYYYVTSKNEYVISALKNSKIIFVRDVKRNPLFFFINTIQSIKHLLKEKPDIIITTGAGIALPTCYIGKIFGKKIIFIESFARVKSVSLFSKLVHGIANKVLVQWKKKNNPKSIYIGPIFDFKKRKQTQKKKQIFVTVGTSNYDFSRLLIELDKIALIIPNYKIIAQIGTNSYIPKNYTSYRMLNNKQMKKLYRESAIVICHSGVGSIMDSLENNCQTIVVPRYKKYKEHIDNHQLEIAKALQKKKYVTAVQNIAHLKKAIINIGSKKTKINFEKGKAVKTINEYIKK